MKIIGIGFSVLVIQLFPTDWIVELITGGGMYGSVFGGISPFWYLLFSLIIRLAMAGMVVWLFFSKTRLSSRLPADIPGKKSLIVGTVLVLLFFVLLLLASTIRGGGATYTVAQFAPLFLVVAKILLVVGAVRVLLAASPVSPRPMPLNGTDEHLR